MSLESTPFTPNGPMFAPRRGSLKDQISVHHVEGAQSARATKQIYDRTLPSLHFLRWRPMFHLLAPNAWMNDPCGPGFDPTTGLYHISFQWNPRRNRHGNVAWGNVAWGSATSKDLLAWKLQSAPTLKPDRPYDSQGIFTGCMVPTGINGGKGTLTAVYTSVKGTPVHYSLPYTRGSETQSIAQSTDNGRTWAKSDRNPILSEPPAHIQPTGWRDPYVAPWATLDKLLGVEDGANLYGTVSGGIAGQSPTLFLYVIPRNQLDKWQLISPLVNIGLNHQISRWSGDMGLNWEAGTFMTLSDQTGASRDFIVVGGEGCKSSETTVTEGSTPKRSTQVSRAARSQQWMSGELVANKGEKGMAVEMKYGFGGRLDHGCLYGVNTFWDPVNSQQIAWGWIREEDLPQHLVDRQNWSGLMSLPRQLKLLTIENVTGTLLSPLGSITSLELTQSSESPVTHTIRTLGIFPAGVLDRLRTSNCRELSLRPNTPLPSAFTPSQVLDVQSCRFEICASVAVPSSFVAARKAINISISHSPNHNLLTTLSFNPSTETLTLHRPDSRTVDTAINWSPEIAPHTLFTFRDASTGADRVETYDVRLFFDESVIEVFVNGRTVISSRVYPGRKRVWGVGIWAGSEPIYQEDTEMNLDEVIEDEETERGSSTPKAPAIETSNGELPTLLQAKSWDGMRADIRIV